LQVLLEELIVHESRLPLFSYSSKPQIYSDPGNATEQEDFPLLAQISFSDCEDSILERRGLLKKED
jgi:hypothetical protein